MRHIAKFIVLFCLQMYHVYSAKLPGPLVYVVTPSSRPQQLDIGRQSPFYYHNWMRRMDTPEEFVSSTTTTAKTPDLIFAEFESGNSNLKSIRKLLENERIQPKTTTTTTPRPIYVPDEDTSDSDSNYGLPQPTTPKPDKNDMTDYFALYNNMQDSGLMYVPSASSASVPIPPTSTTTSPTTTTTETMVNNVQNVWQIIDSQKHDQLADEDGEEETASNAQNNIQADENTSNESEVEVEQNIDENFALPGFGTNSGSGAENESRAIRTEPNIRFPYVNLKPFKMKNFNTKKNNNMFSLDSFTEIKKPVRGEVQDTHMIPIQQPIDRYNPAQPYLPSYGTNLKPSSGYTPMAPAPAPASRPPTKTFANLVPPPPPPAPQLTADDFPTPSTYESFPPYASGGPGGSAPTFSFPPLAASAPDPSSADDDSLPSGYRYKPAPVASKPLVPGPPAPTKSSFIPTLPPLSKPFSGYSYDKPSMPQQDPPPTMDADKPDFQGYFYNKPAPPAPPVHSPNPPPPQDDYSAPSYGDHDAAPPSYQSGGDYPDLIYDKPHGMKGGDSGKGNDMDMMPPPPPSDTKPNAPGSVMDDHGFPHDFPGDFKYSHDFDDHDYHHHHHHPTTTTTEQPRVNRYSYYYLGKKLYYLPLYFSVYFVIYVGALIIKAVLRHKITYPNSYRPNDTTATFFSKRSVESHLSNDNLHEITGRVTKAIATVAEKYINEKSKQD